MPSREQFQSICLTRLEEVKVLYEKGLYDGANYLSGYVVETALKARVCKILESDYPDSGEISRSFLTHKFDTLVRLAGLSKALDRESNTNTIFKTNWSIATGWSEAERYSPIGTNDKLKIEELISALTDNNNGVLTWIMKTW